MSFSRLEVGLLYLTYQSRRSSTIRLIRTSLEEIDVSYQLLHSLKAMEGKSGWFDRLNLLAEGAELHSLTFSSIIRAPFVVSVPFRVRTLICWALAPDTSKCT